MCGVYPNDYRFFRSFASLLIVFKFRFWHIRQSQNLSNKEHFSLEYKGKDRLTFINCRKTSVHAFFYLPDQTTIYFADLSLHLDPYIFFSF